MPRPTRSRRARPVLEVLEDRHLLTVGLPTPGEAGGVSLAGTTEDDALIVRLAPGNPTQIEFSDDGGDSYQSAALADVTGIDVQGLRGRDVLTIDHSNGLVALPSGLTLTFDGGHGVDVIRIVGDPKVTMRQVYAVGETADSGALTFSGGGQLLTVFFAATSALLDTATASNLTISLTDGNDVALIGRGRTVDEFGTLRLGGIDTHGLSDGVDGIIDDGGRPDHAVNPAGSFVPLTLANKAGVTLHGEAGNDLFILDATRPVTGLASLIVDGGDGSDRTVGDDVPRGAALTTTSVERNLPDGTEDRFLQRLFIERLHRVATDGELEAWRNTLRGPNGQANVVVSVERSLEVRTRLVDAWFRHYLGRPAGDSAAAAIGAALQQFAVTDQQYLAALAASQEFYARAVGSGTFGTADERFVRLLYQVVLGRDGQEAEVQAVAGLVPTAGRMAIASVFVNSVEYRQNVVAAFYDRLLRRDADPGGIEFWSAAAANLTQVRETFQVTQEYLDDSRMDGVVVQIGPTGQARLQGTSASRDDRQFFVLAAPRTGPLRVQVQTTNGVFADLEVEDSAGRRVFETEPQDGVNAGQFTLLGGGLYVVRLRAPGSVPATFVVDLTLLG